MDCPVCHAPLPEQATSCPACNAEISSEPAWLERVATQVLSLMYASEDEVRQWVALRRTQPGADNATIAAQAVESAKWWTAGIGFTAGLGDFLGPLGFGVGTTADIYYSAKLAVEMGQRVYCAYGHDIASDEVRVRILAALGGGAAATGKVVGEGAARVSKRLLETYLRGAVLKALKAFLRKLGIVFTRKALVAALPVLGSGVNAVVNRRLMGALGASLVADASGATAS